MFGEFVEADIAAVDSHGLGVGGESDDAGAIVELNRADFDFLGEGAFAAIGVEAWDLERLFAMGDDGAGEVEEFGEFVNLVHVFEGAGPIFGGEEVMAFFEAEAFADIFEAVGIGPADADGFFGEGEGLFAEGVDLFLGVDPIELVRHEMLEQLGVGVDGETGEDGAHKADERWWINGLVD
ncbi:MAG TPA: hypothetical protein VN578_11045 [Candidatus Binatia bacterium]|nr:hypothetical protein [Candidatus Binatia bacterium]